MRYTKETLEEVVKRSNSWADVCRELGVKSSTGSQSYITKRCKLEGIDSSHFAGRSHNKGRVARNKKDALEYCFRGSKINSHSLKLALIRDGYKLAECELCGLSEWKGEPIVLELDHKDSDHSNNEINNLQIVCPNCHALETRHRLAE